MIHSGANMEDREPQWFTRFRETLNTRLDTLTNRLNEVDRKLEGIQTVKKMTEENRSMIEDMQKEINSLKQRVIHSEAQSKRNNLIFDGIAESHTRETWADCEEKIYTLLEKNLGIATARNIKFERVHRLGPYIPDNVRGIIAKFTYFQDREMVWKERTKLKDSSKDIWISEDYPREIKATRKILYPILRAALKEAKDLNITRRVSLNLDKLVIDGKVYTINDLHKLPPTLRPENISTKTEGNVTVFYTRDSILSNFHMNTPFKIDGIKYNCTEQYIQNAKAMLFNDDEIAYKIMRAKSSHEQCQLGRKVKGYNEHRWMQVAHEVLYKANMAKVDQNEQAKTALLQTESNVLGEASKNKRWGIGLSLNDDNVTKTQFWQGDNIFGKVLEKVRGQIKTKHCEEYYSYI